MLAIRAPIVVFVIRGEADLPLGDYTLHLPAGYFCLIPPEVARPDGSEPHLTLDRRHQYSCDLLWVRASENGVEAWTCHSQGEKHWGGRLRERISLPRREIWSLFSLMVRECEDAAPENAAIAQNLLEVIFALLLREARSTPLSSASSSPHLSPKARWDSMQYAREYIRNHLQDELKVERLAKATYMAGSQFRKRFRLETGQTFTEFLTQSRLEKAGALLRDTDWAVSAIAPLVGYNPSHMRRLFCKHFGISPQKYRIRERARLPRYVPLGASQRKISGKERCKSHESV
jgi:AraC-like DNA-binding protein